MSLDDLSEPSGCAMSDLPGTVEQAVHQRLTHPLEWPLFHLKQTRYIHNTVPHTSIKMATLLSKTHLTWGATAPHSKHHFSAPSSQLCQNCYSTEVALLSLFYVHQCCQHPPKGLGTNRKQHNTHSTHVNMRHVHPRFKKKGDPP